MHRGGCLVAAGIDCCAANNHVLDWGYEASPGARHVGSGGIEHAGAGRNAEEAESLPF
jgi:hypothetical protein